MLQDPGPEHRLMLCRAFCHPPYSVEAGGGRATAHPVPVHFTLNLMVGVILFKKICTTAPCRLRRAPAASPPTGVLERANVSTAHTRRPQPDPRSSGDRHSPIKHPKRAKGDGGCPATLCPSPRPLVTRHSRDRHGSCNIPRAPNTISGAPGFGHGHGGPASVQSGM